MLDTHTIIKEDAKKTTKGTTICRKKIENKKQKPTSRSNGKRCH